MSLFTFVEPAAGHEVKLPPNWRQAVVHGHGSERDLLTPTYPRMRTRETAICCETQAVRRFFDDGNGPTREFQQVPPELSFLQGDVDLGFET